MLGHTYPLRVKEMIIAVSCVTRNTQSPRKMGRPRKERRPASNVSMTTLIHKIIPEILTLFPTDLTYIHYWTYSPTSQYRDKNAFSFISNHLTMLVSQQPATTLRQATDMAHAVVPVAQHKINAA